MEVAVELGMVVTMGIILVIFGTPGLSMVMGMVVMVMAMVMVMALVRMVIEMDMGMECTQKHSYENLKDN
jgi:hypothetical protein